MKKYIDLDDMVNINCSNVLDIIQKNGVVSRKEITQLSGLSWGGMTKIVNKLLEHGYIKEEKVKKSPASGRTPCVLSVNTEKNFIIGLDINKTGLNAIVMDLTGKILERVSVAVSAENRNEFLNEIISFLSEIFNNFAPNLIISIGIAMQGIVDCKTGVSVKFPDILDWNHVPLKDILEERFHVHVFVEHDPDCLLFPHIEYGTKENTILFRIDKSIGMAVAINGKIMKGEGLFEIAHTTVIPDGLKCYCGKNGCIESYIRPCIEQNGIDTAKAEELLLPLTLTITNMTQLFNADKIILTGVLMEYEWFQHQLLENFRDKNIMFSPVSDFAIRGAALIAINKSINSLLL